MPSALITGVTGQDGAYLAEMLLDMGYRVSGLVQQQGGEITRDVARKLEGVDVFVGDLRDGSSLRAAISTCDPDEVYNFAGISSVAQSWRDPVQTTEVNAVAVLHLVQAVMNHEATSGHSCRMLQASSAEM